MIESPVDLDPGYKSQLKKMLRIAGDTEFRSVPMLRSYFEIGVPERYVKPIIAIMQDECGHAHIDYRLLESLGEDIECLMFDRDVSEWTYPFLFDMPVENIYEIAAIEGLAEYCGGLLVRNIYHHSNYGPWRRALAKVDREENFHVRFGQSMMADLSKNESDLRGLQAAVDWVFPSLLEFFGPPSERESDVQIAYGLKGQTTDELRQEFLKYAVPFCEKLNLRVPAKLDPESNEYVLECAFPAAFDPEKKEWDLGREVAWSAVFSRWKERGPMARQHLKSVRAGYETAGRWLS